MGLAGWYRKFVPIFASISAPITDCLKKGKKFVFTEEAAQAFEQIKEALITSPVLQNPDFKKHFDIQCDASNNGIGALLFQKDEDDQEHLIFYFSKKLNGVQINYTVTVLRQWQ